MGSKVVELLVKPRVNWKFVEYLQYSMTKYEDKGVTSFIGVYMDEYLLVEILSGVVLYTSDHLHMEVLDGINWDGQPTYAFQFADYDDILECSETLSISNQILNSIREKFPNESIVSLHQ